MQRQWMVRFVTAGLLILLAICSKTSSGQAVTGTLLGTVQDSSGAVVPGANVTLTNEGTNVISKTTTGPQGFYTFPNLTPGLYSVTIATSGFKTAISQHNQVQVEQSTRVDIALRRGR